MTWYGQHEEDRYIAAAFAGQSTGWFVDVGAYDGIYLSNTLHFEQQGWRGVCIEPHKQTYLKLRENLPGSMCVWGACVSPYASHVQVYKHAGDILLGGLNPPVSHMQGQCITEMVTGWTLDTILKDYLSDAPMLDFVSIDTEGTEIDVLKGFTLARWKPRVICVEHEHCDRDALRDVMGRAGYIMARVVGCNTLYCSTVEIAQRLRELT